MQTTRDTAVLYDDGLWAIRHAATEEELVEAAREYLDEWSSYDLCQLPAVARPGELETAEDLLLFAIGVLDCSIACPQPCLEPLCEFAAAGICRLRALRGLLH